MTEIKLYKTTSKGLKIIGMCLPFVAIGLWMITQEPIGSTNYIMGWVCTCFFGLGIPVGLFQTFDRRPQIIITESGIWDRTTNQDEVKWEQIIEAYPLDLFDQKFISLATDDTFILKKKLYKWAAKINKKIGAQNLNLQLSQINIDVIEFTNFINRLSKESVEERRKLIKTFNVNRNNFSFSDILKIFVYVSISIFLLLLSLTSFKAYMTIMIVMGIAAITWRWHWGDVQFSNIRKYSEILTWLGLVNMVLCLGVIKIYDNITENLGELLTIEIEEYKSQNTTLPTDIKSITNKLEINFFERYFAEKIEYRINEDDYILEADMLFGKRRKYNQNNGEWK